MKITAILLTSFLFVSTTHAQIKIPKPELKLPNISSFLKGEDPLTTTLDDAPFYVFPRLEAIPYAQEPILLTKNDLNAKGTFTLKPGSYRFEMQSFCARGYSFGPTETMGYTYGNWKGPKAQFLQTLLRNYAKSEGVTQKEVQLLIWAVLARVKPNDLRPEQKATLVKLMGNDSLKLLADGALDHFSGQIESELNKTINRELRDVFKFENNMRGLFRKANAQYNEFERLAVIEPPTPNPKSDVPRATWLPQPGRFLLRYLPKGYSHTTVEIFVPQKPTVVRNPQKLVTSVEFPDLKLTINYKPDATPTPYPSDKAVSAYPVSSVTITTPKHGTNTYELENGFVLSGRPTKKKSALSISQRFFANIPLPSPLPQFGGWGDRYERVQEISDRIETYEEWYARTQRIERGEQPEEDVFDSGHIRDLIDSLRGGTDDRLGQIADTHGRLAEWLAYATGRIDSLGEGSEFDPSGNVILPGNRGGQRLVGAASGAI